MNIAAAQAGSGTLEAFLGFARVVVDVNDLARQVERRDRHAEFAGQAELVAGRDDVRRAFGTCVSRIPEGVATLSRHARVVVVGIERVARAVAEAAADLQIP